jgi:flagellar hook-associated protein 2
MQVEQQPLTALAQKEASYQAKLSAFGTMQGALSTLQTAAQALKNSSTFTGKSATASDSTVLSASATNTAAAGSYSVTVKQLAKFNAIRSDTNYANTTDTFNTGTLSISVGGGTAVDVTIDSNNNTLTGIRKAINDANTGVTASIVNDGTTNRLVLSSKTSGSAGQISVSVSNESSGETYSLGGLDTTSGSIFVTQTADDAMLDVNGIAITRSSNVVSDAIEGVTLNLTKGTQLNPATTTVTVAANTSGVTSAVDAFVKAYNDSVGQLKTLTAYDTANKKASVLTGDSTARSIQAQLNSLVWSNVSGVNGGISSLSDIGISLQKDGKLSVDSSKLSAALADPTKDVASLFTQTTDGNKGIAVRFNDMLTGIVGTDGLIAGRTDGINISIKSLQQRSDAMDLRLVQIETRYRRQFSSLDTMLSKMQQTSQYLTQQLANLPSTSSQ